MKIFQVCMMDLVEVLRVYNYLLFTFLTVLLLNINLSSAVPAADVQDFLSDGDPFGNLSSNDERLADGKRRAVDAQDSWLAFVRRSKRLQNDKQSGRKRKNKRKQQRLRCPPGPAGPVGPPGPAGPPGPKGAIITIEDLMTEFKELVKEAAESRAYELMIQKCASCADTVNSTGVDLSSSLDDVATIPRITSGFHMRLRRNTVVSGRTFMELDSFHQPFAAGSFHRGDSFNVRNGRFGAPKSGIYQFSVNLHVRVKKKGQRSKLRRKDSIKSQICIDSLCHKYASLQHYSGLESNSKIFTISYSGFLELSAGQYASVYVDNASNINVVIQSHSDFSGVMVGQ